MITRQHISVTVLAMIEKGKTMDQIKARIPWVVLPDGIRAFIGPRQASHFERTPDENECAWMIFPSAETLKNLTKDNVKDLVKFYIPENAYPKCVIGERTDTEVFTKYNFSHEHYQALYMHLMQDCILDEVLRKNLIDATFRFEDRFVIRHNDVEIDGAMLRKQVALFEELGFIHLAGMVYERTGVLLTGKWFEENVYEPLKAVYPQDLAENTFKYMRYSEELDARIRAKKFELSEEEVKEFILADDLMKVLDDMYKEAIDATSKLIF